MRRTKEEALQTRENILKAAAQVLARLGVNAFTLDAVAREACITKGGVLHHFPSKESLIDSLIDQVIEAFNTRLTEELAKEPEAQPGRWLRAYIRTVFFISYKDKNLSFVLAAAASAEHQPLERIRRSLEERQQAIIQDGIAPIQATIIRLAVDGLVFAKALDIDVLDADTSQSVYEELIRLTVPANTQ
jgi:AcrR family transcriptional regulator